MRAAISPTGSDEVFVASSACSGVA